MQTRSAVSAPSTRRAPHQNPSERAPGATPDGGPPPRHSMAPAASAHSHSPSSGKRGYRCSHRALRHSNGLASTARSTQTRSRPMPWQRYPSGDGLALGSAGSVADTGFLRSSQHTYAFRTSPQCSVVPCTGAGTSARRSGATGTSFFVHALATSAQMGSVRAAKSGSHGSLTGQDVACVAPRTKGPRARHRSKTGEGSCPKGPPWHIRRRTAAFESWRRLRGLLRPTGRR